MSNGLNDAVVGLNDAMVMGGKTKQLINLDNAASTPPLKAVLQAVNDFAPWYSSVHRGSGLKSRLSTQLYEEARSVVANFFGANQKDHVVIFGKNTTEAINKLSYRIGLNKRDIVLISHLEHHSNDLPWRARAIVKRISLTADGGIDKDDYNKLLRQYGQRIKIVAISGASNVTGHIPDIHWFAREAHAIGAQILVDCAQLAAHRPIRMGGLSDPSHLDYIAVSGHKMYAPFGTGALIGRKDTFELGEPEYVGGGTINFVTPKTVDWSSPPDSDEAGSPNVIGAVAFARALKELQQLDLKAIVAHESGLTSHALTRLKEVPGLSVYGNADPKGATKRSGVIPFNLTGMPANLVAAILGYEHGISVRSGCFCAHPYVMSLLGLEEQDVKVARDRVLHANRRDMPGMVRISFGLYNTTDDVDALIEALCAIASGKHGKYKLDLATGSYQPVGFTDDFRDFFEL